MRGQINVGFKIKWIKQENIQELHEISWCTQFEIIARLKLTNKIVEFVAEDLITYQMG